MKKILVACSSEMSPCTAVAKKVGSMCKEKGISCATVQCTAEEAKSKARALRPDLIIGKLDFTNEFDVPVLEGEKFMEEHQSQIDMDELMSFLKKK